LIRSVRLLATVAKKYARGFTVESLLVSLSISYQNSRVALMSVIVRLYNSNYHFFCS